MGSQRHSISRRGFITKTGAVGGTAACPNAVLATLATPLGQQMGINVRTFGARGDGASDDTLMIRAAIDAASARGGASVLFPPGVYKVSSPIQVPSNICMYGAGRGSTIHDMKGNQSILFLGNCQGRSSNRCGSPGRASWAWRAGGRSGLPRKMGPGRVTAES